MVGKFKTCVPWGQGSTKKYFLITFIIRNIEFKVLKAYIIYYYNGI